MARVNKTKVGSEYRVRGSQGNLYGEFNKPTKAMKKATKVSVKKHKINCGHSSKSKGGY